jgi:hypothetical protein
MEGLPASAEYVTHELDLTPGEDALFSGYRSNVQRNTGKREEDRGGEQPTPLGVRGSIG